MQMINMKLPNNFAKRVSSTSNANTRQMITKQLSFDKGEEIDSGKTLVNSEDEYCDKFRNVQAQQKCAAITFNGPIELRQAKKHSGHHTKLNKFQLDLERKLEQRGSSVNQSIHTIHSRMNKKLKERNVEDLALEAARDYEKSYFYVSNPNSNASMRKNSLDHNLSSGRQGLVSQVSSTLASPKLQKVRVKQRINKRRKSISINYHVLDE